MQCHLGFCPSLRCDLTLEPFTRGLASEDANQHAQRFVAVVVRRSLPCNASKLPTSLPRDRIITPHLLSLSISAFALSVFASRLAAIT
jgi:hypothetical protein